MRPQISQVKRHLTHATSHDRLSISKKLFGLVAFLKQLVLKFASIDITRLVSTYNAFVCGQLNVKLLFNQVYLVRCSLCCSKSMIYLKAFQLVPNFFSIHCFARPLRPSCDQVAMRPQWKSALRSFKVLKLVDSTKSHEHSSVFFYKLPKNGI